MNRRIWLIGFMLLSILGLAACVPSQVVSSSVMPTQVGSLVGTATAQPASAQTEESEEQIVVPPTVAPTATPGLIIETVERAVGSSNVVTVRFLGLTLEDWVNLIISLLVVVLVVTLVARIIVLSLKKFARRTSTPYDELYIDSIQTHIRWLLGLIALNYATTRLQFLSPVFKQWLSQVYFVLGIGVLVVILWKLVDIFALWYREKVEEGDEKEKEAVLLLAERALRTLLILVGLIIVLDNLGFNVGALLAALGIGGLALSLAAQDTIANMISGVIILITYFMFLSGDAIEKKVGQSGMNAMTRIMGLILTTIGVGIFLEGLAGALDTYIPTISMRLG